tara:strand:+ start:5600 stop:5761 length:162 start_codon:yes stop_codon:yes gene_type:complete
MVFHLPRRSDPIKKDKGYIALKTIRAGNANVKYPQKDILSFRKFVPQHPVSNT